MTAWQLEQQIYDMEGIRLVIRAPYNQELDTGEYDYQRRAAGNSSLTEWLAQRVFPLTGAADITVIDGSGRIPHGRTHMNTVRESYAVRTDF